MMTKFMYVVDHFVPFPASEYGGIWNVIAENDEECFDLIAAEDEGDYYVNDYKTLKLNINQARTYQLANEVESQIVEEFTT